MIRLREACLGQLLCTPSDGCTETMLAEAVWSFGEVLTGALAINYVVDGLAVALAGDLGRAIG
jgi:hypothetical protein